MPDYQVVYTSAALNASLEARLAAIGAGAGGVPATIETMEKHGSYAGGVADSTLDDPAFAAAIASLAAQGGGTLQLYHNYSLSNPALISGDTCSNIAFVGMVPNAGFTHAADTPSADSSAIIHIIGTSAYSMTNFSMVGVTIAGHSTSDYRRLLNFGNITGVMLDRCRFVNNAAEGVYFAGQNSCKTVTAINCYAESVGVGASQYLSAYNLNAEGSFLFGCKAFNCGQGLEQSGSDCRILGNHIENTNSFGLLIASTWSAYLDLGGVEVDDSNVLIVGNIIKNCTTAITTGDTSGHTNAGHTFKGNQGRISIKNNQILKCAQFFSGGSDSLTETIIDENYIDDAPNGGSYCISASRGRFVIKNNVFRLGPTSAWAGLIRIGDQDPVNTSGLIDGNTVDGLCWTGNAFVLGPNVTIKRTTFVNVPTTTKNYYVFAGSNLTADGAVSQWTLNTDAWLVQNDSTFCYSPFEPSAMRVLSSPPSKGTWKIGDTLTNVAGTGVTGFRCTLAGTADTILGGVTATTTSSSTAIALTAATKVMQWSWLTIAGVTGRYQLTAYDPSTGAGTIAPAAAAGVSGAAVTYAPPVWEVIGVLATKAVTAAYTVTPLDQMIAYSTTSAAYAITLTAAATSEGRVLRFMKSDSNANALTLTAAGSDHINGAGTFAPVQTQYGMTIVTCVNGQWYAFDAATAGGGGGGGAVSTVFGRSGTVTAQSNDYTYAQLASKPTTLAGISSGVATDFVTQFLANGDPRYLQIGTAIADSLVTDSPFYTITSPGATPAVTWRADRRQQVMTLTTNATPVISGIPAGGALLLRVIQAASGGPYTVTHTVSGLGTLYPDLGVAPTMTSTPSKFDDYLYRYDGTRTVYARILTGAG